MFLCSIHVRDVKNPNFSYSNFLVEIMGKQEKLFWEFFDSLNRIQVLQFSFLACVWFAVEPFSSKSKRLFFVLQHFIVKGGDFMSVIDFQGLSALVKPESGVAVTVSRGHSNITLAIFWPILTPSLPLLA